MLNKLGAKINTPGSSVASALLSELVACEGFELVQGSRISEPCPFGWIDAFMAKEKCIYQS